MDAAQLEEFRAMLLDWRRELLADAGRTVDGMAGSKETFADPSDRASLESSRNAMLRIRDRERKLLTKIDEALERIDDGSYGICESCGEPIAPERLSARLVTTMCVDCKSAQENSDQRRRGW